MCRWYICSFHRNIFVAIVCSYTIFYYLYRYLKNNLQLRVVHVWFFTRNLEQKWILALFSSLPILGVIEFDLQFNFEFQTQTKLSFLCTSLVFFSETSYYESWENSEGVNHFKEQPLEQLLGMDCFTVSMFHGGIILSVPLEEDLLGWGLWWDWGSSIFTILCCILV